MFGQATFVYCYVGIVNVRSSSVLKLTNVLNKLFQIIIKFQSVVPKTKLRLREDTVIVYKAREVTLKTEQHSRNLSLSHMLCKEMKILFRNI